MEKLQIRLMVLLALGTISGCQEVGEPHSDSVSVALLTPQGGCGPPKTVDVRFNEIKVTGDGSDVVYRRVTVTDLHLQFAMNASVSFPSDGLVGCAKAAARAGLEAFVFKENCTGYQLNHRFLKCQRGDLVVFVQADILAEEAAVVPFDEAPYSLNEYGGYRLYRMYMLSAFVGVDDDHPEFQKVTEFDGDGFDDAVLNFIYLKNGDIIQTLGTLLDVNFCFNDGAYGLPIALTDIFYHIKLPWPTVYFFQECGKMFKFTTSWNYTDMLVFSHPGFGCKYYPSDLPNECTVNFESDEPTWVRYGFYFSETNSDDAGLIMTINVTNTNTGETMTENIYQSNQYRNVRGNTFNVSLQSQPSKRAIGFFFEF